MYHVSLKQIQQTIMKIEELKEDDKVHYIDKHSIPRKGTVQRNRTVNGKLFLTVKSESGVVEVLREKKKVVALG